MDAAPTSPAELRDHSQPCEHGLKLMHNAEFVGNTIAIVPPCPGGRVVTDDDIRRLALDLADHDGSLAERAALASALGVADE